MKLALLLPLIPLLALAAAPAQAGFVVTNGAPVLRPEPPYVSCGYEEQRPNASAWRFSVSDAKPSPDGQFTAMVFAAGHEDHDWCARWLELRYPDGQSLWLGSSARGIGVKWWTTQIGPVLSIENDQDTHFSESIVLRPLGDRAAEGFDVLYRTTDSALPLVEHSYTEVEDISVAGILTLRHVWDYGPKQSGTGSGIWRIPLFLGRAIAPSMNSESSAEVATNAPAAPAAPAPHAESADGAKEATP